MVRPIDLLRQGRKNELWLMCCGFIDLSLDHFMTIQKRLLLEQIDLLKASRMGTKVMRGAMPQTVEEFRREVPLTTYSDYCPELQERREYVLPAKPIRWIRTSGYSGTYDIKWVPWSARFAAECEKVMCSLRPICHSPIPRRYHHSQGAYEGAVYSGRSRVWLQAPWEHFSSRRSVSTSCRPMQRG